MPSRSSLPVALLASLIVLTGCGGSDGGAAPPSVDPTEAHLQDQLDALPAVDGATRTVQQFDAGALTESFTVPAGSPACLQVLAILDAGGYEVVAGAGEVAVVPTTCRTADDDPAVSTVAGTATILARGGSQIALTWTATAYTIAISST